MVTLRCVDFETTSMPPNASVLEIGYTDVSYQNGWGTLHNTHSYLVYPSHPIAWDALIIHHITPEEIMEKAEVGWQKALHLLGQAPVDVWVAHNNEFERFFFKPPKPWICTFKVARRLWPNAPNHKNQTLRYFLKVGVRDPLADPPHRAGPDTYVTALILLEALKKMSIQEMIDISNAGATATGQSDPSQSQPPQQPSMAGGGGGGGGGGRLGTPLSQRGTPPPQGQLLETCEFGQKYLGRPWASIPDSFLQYCQQNTRDPDVLFTVTYWLNKRRGAAK